MAAGFTSPLPVLGLSQGPEGAGFVSPMMVLGLSADASGSLDGGATSYWGWWMGGFSGYASSSTSPWYFLKSNRKRRSD